MYLNNSRKREFLLLLIKLVFVPMIGILFVLNDAWAYFQFAGNVKSTVVSTDTVDFVLDQGAVARIQMQTPDIVRVRFNPKGVFSDFSSGAIKSLPVINGQTSIFDMVGAAYMVSPKMTIVILKSPFRIVMFRSDGNLILADMDNYAIGWETVTGMVFNRKYAPTDEHYFGLGLRGGPLDRRGRTFFMRNTDWAGYQEFTDPLYVSIPFYYGVREGNAYGLFLDNPATPFFDMDSQLNGTVTIGAIQGELDYYVFTGPKPSDVAAAYTSLTGSTPLPPKWTLGYHQSRFGYQSQGEFLNLASTFRQLKIPCDALYLDLHYMDNLHTLTWDPVRFPNPIIMNTLLESNGFKRVAIIDPVVRTDDPLWPFMSASKYFLSDGLGTPLVNTIFYGDVSWIDFSKTTVRNDYKQILQTFLATGISGVWNDLNEPAQNFMPEAFYDFNGNPKSDLEARNLYALLGTSLSIEAQKTLYPNIRPWVLSRSGYSGIQRYAANWSGDTLSTFDSLRVSVQISQSMGLSGQNQFGHDIGGFLGSPTPELFIRWLGFASFTPFFRNHAVDTSSAREPWQFGEPYTTMARDIISRRYKMLPYIYTLFENASKGKDPVVSPVFYYFPTDQSTYKLDQEFMVGSSLLVAPVVEQGVTSRNVYLPAGSNWFDYYTDILYSGGQNVTVTAPLERTPQFVREGAVIPGGPVLQYVTENVSPIMTVDTYPSYPASDTSYILYEDDGWSIDYVNGIYLRTLLSRREIPIGTEFAIQRIEGSWGPPVRPWSIYFHNESLEPVSVELNGIQLLRANTENSLNNVEQGWFYSISERKIIVRITDSGQAISLLIRR